MPRVSRYLIVLVLLLSFSCAIDTPSKIPGYHWYNNNGTRSLVENKTGHVMYWMFNNVAGTCTARQLQGHSLEFTEDFVDCDTAVRAIELREKH